MALPSTAWYDKRMPRTRSLVLKTSDGKVVLTLTNDYVYSSDSELTDTWVDD